MHVLIVHPEPTYFAGAEKMLAYFLEQCAREGAPVTVAVSPGSRLAEAVPSGVKSLALPDDRRFSVLGLLRKTAGVARAHRERPFDVVHGWAARDWELSSLIGWRLGRPALGTLHDHPRAAFLSKPRRNLMRGSARWGLRTVACVSAALRAACVEAGYPSGKLEVVHNGLPPREPPELRSNDPCFRIGYLGVFIERKGFRGLFAILEELARLTAGPWEMAMAGGTQDQDGERLVREIEERHRAKPWWGRLRWEGWVKEPGAFLRSVDALLCPSSEFDPFPTVLLEAGQAGVPALAAKVGGIPEIVREEESGWLFEAGDWTGAAQILARLAGDRDRVLKCGAGAARRVAEEFSIGKMVAEYRRLYSTMRAYV